MRPRPNSFSSSSISAGAGRTFQSATEGKRAAGACGEELHGDLAAATAMLARGVPAASRAAVRRPIRILSTMRRASFSRRRSSSLTLLARSTQVFANSSKRSLPSMSSSASFTRISRYCWIRSSKNPHRDAAGVVVEHDLGARPALAQFLHHAGNRDRLAAKECASALGARRGFVGVDVVDDAAGDEPRQIVDEAVDRMTG